MVPLRHRAIGIILILTATALAGCSDDTPLDPAPQRDGDGREEREDAADSRDVVRERVDHARQATNGTSSADDAWYLLSLKADPDGAAAGFSIKIPAGASHAGPGTHDPPRPVLEIVPVLAEGQEEDLLQWGVVAFVGNEAAIPSGARLELSATNVDAFGKVSYESPTAAPLLWDTGEVQSNTERYPRVREQEVPRENLTFVLGARLAEEGEFGLALRFLHQVPSAPVKDLSAFLAAVGEADPVTPEPIGTTDRFVVAEARLRTLPLSFPNNEPLWALTTTDDIDVAQGTLVEHHLGLIDLTLSFDAQVENGTTVARAARGLSTGAGRWTIEAEMHGVEWDEQGVTTPWGGSFYGGVKRVDLGQFYYEIAANGTGTSRFTITITQVDLAPLSPFLVRHIVLGSPLDHLLGTPLMGDHVPPYGNL